jgi:hypothetical protein
MPIVHEELQFDKIKHETDKAYIIVCDTNEFVVPKSLVQDLDVEEGLITLPEWFIEQEGMDEYVL